MPTFQTSDVKLTENILWLLIIHSVYRYFPSQYRPRPKEPITQNVPRITNCVLLSTWLSFQIYQGSLKNQLASSCYGTWEDESVLSFSLACSHLRIGLLEDVYLVAPCMSLVCSSPCNLTLSDCESRDGRILPYPFLFFFKNYVFIHLVWAAPGPCGGMGALTAAPRLRSCSSQNL